MYETYYGLTELPFALTPDTEFYFQNSSHQDALNVLLVALNNGDGFLKLTGEVGTGKTLLCRKLLDLLQGNFQTVYIPNPYMSSDALLRAVTTEMGILPCVRNGDYLSEINRQLVKNAQQGMKTVILLDEAQSLPVETLEAIRLLSNLETKKHKLVQIVLFGQPELDQKLSATNIRQLRQRIVHACQLKKLTLSSLALYIEHRMASANYHGPSLFDKPAIKRLYHLTGGTPRLINLLCHKALLLAYSSGAFYVSKYLVNQAGQDSQQVSETRLSGFRAAGLLG
jgi:MSHA biogenesis protein MshM